METVEPNAVLAVGAALVAGLTLLAVVAILVATRPRRPDGGPATMELGAEPPAVVDLLTDRYQVTPEAAPATLLDLAARRWLVVEDLGPDTTVIRLRRFGGDGQLTPYEQRILDHLRTLAVDGVVPAEALTTGPEGASASWWNGFRKEVIADARARGLSRKRFGAGPRVLAWAGVFAGGGLCYFSVGEIESNETIGFSLPFVIAFALLVVLGVLAARITTMRQERETEAGLAAGSRWLGVRRYLADHGRFDELPASAVQIWDQYLAHAAALDLATGAARQLPLGAEDDEHAWSRHGGQWRQVDVDYLTLRPGWGHHPFAALLSGLVVTVIAGWVGATAVTVARDPAGVDALGDLGSNVQGWIALGAALVAAAALLVGAWWLVRAVNGVVGFLTASEVRGTVLRKRRRGSEDDRGPGVRKALSSVWHFLSRPEHGQYQSRQRREPRHYLAVDDGTADEIHAWRVRPEIHRAVRQGDEVVARVWGRTGYVRSIEPVGRPAAPAPAAPGEEAVRTMVEGFSAELVAAAQELAARHERVSSE